MRIKMSLQLACVICLLAISFRALAVADFLDRWRTEYPKSNSGDIRCQLCHVAREGGSPWNAYGRDIRSKFNLIPADTRTIEQAFRLVEGMNSDGDDRATTNLDEIAANEQPGWRPGKVNFAYDRNDQIAGVFSQPVTVDPFPEAIKGKSYPLELLEVASGFTSPIGGVAGPTPALSDQMFVVDQVGLVWRVDLNSGEKSRYLDVKSRLLPLGAFSPGGYDERGLLGFAFHPDFASNGRLYIHTSEPVAGAADFTTLSSDQIANHQGVITELIVDNVSGTSGAAQVGAQREVLRFDQPQFNHNGGALLFDAYGYLLIALGDGGGADDQGVGHGESGNGGDPSNPFGSILRIDPLGSDSSNGKYGIPASNPFVENSGFLSEIFAYGFRNPWKLSFDQNGQLYVADVGQNDIEEISLVEKGKHYGWPVKEGRFFFDPNDEFSGIITVEVPSTLPAVSLIDPILQYDHDEGISVTGGYVYRGTRNPSLWGKYIFGDFQKRLFVGDLSNGEINELKLASEIFIFSFARDNDGELYFMGNATARTDGAEGKLIKLQSTLIDQGEICFPVIAKSGNVSVICL